MKTLSANYFISKQFSSGSDFSTIILDIVLLLFFLKMFCFFSLRSNMLEYGKSQTCFVSALGPETLTYSEKVMPTNGRSLFNAIVRGTERGPAAAQISARLKRKIRSAYYSKSNSERLCSYSLSFFQRY